SNQLVALVPAPDAQYMVAAGVKGPYLCLGVKGLFLGADLFQTAQTFKLFALAGGGVVAQFRQIPLEIAPVQVAAVVPLFGIVVVGVVVQLADLIAAVQHGN